MSGTHDFHTLSHLDFEELVRDLLQAEWDLHLESFGVGRDMGIDARYLNGPQKVIVQAKHMYASGFRKLLRELVDEREKAVRLSPSRYVLATSVPLTALRKDQIIAAMPGVPLALHDIFGQEELNNLIRKHAKVEQQHFKLWLSSTAVLERILHSGVYNRTAAEIDVIKAMVPKFVQNQSVAEAEEKLSETGALIIAGPPSVGKTTLARILLWKHAEQKWRIFVVDSLEEAFRVADSSEKRLILLDDFLGQVRLSEDHMRGIDARLPPLIARVAAYENLRFVLTTRDYIYAQAHNLSSRLGQGQSNAREYVINVGIYTRAVKARILYNHLYFSALNQNQRSDVLADDFFLKVIDHKNFNPRIIEEVTNPDYLALTDGNTRETIMAVLANPSVLWDRPYRQHISREGQILMLALFVNGRSSGIAQLKSSYVKVARALGLDLHPADVESSFRSTFKTLEGSVIALFHGVVIFSNPGIRDFLQSVVTSDKLVPILLPELDTSSEIEELWGVFKGQRPNRSEVDQLADAWISALDRVEASELCSGYDLLELALDLYHILEGGALEVRIERLVSAFSEVPMDGDAVASACSLLEKIWGCELPYKLENTVRTVVTNATATMLKDFADSLSFEDIQSLVAALRDYWDGGEIVEEATAAAMLAIEEGIASEIEQIETVEELNEFETNLLKFLAKRQHSAHKVEREIDSRRDHLLEEGKIEPSESYRGGSSFRSEPGMSNAEIRSMFQGLSKN